MAKDGLEVALECREISLQLPFLGTATLSVECAFIFVCPRV